ncbi:TetR family transcriptional regulator [Aeromicrobium sp. PE09-221]|uniref:TetR/AcrR family transcriptional regulator n=1 Tax=Aeromicrobium sp. PE09-221 TaxID=1898043 RepID=UPI000B6E4BA2|nr:TetR/AcrR family transcriptional regulator [Aeromicrobium sp. PE09-221]OUZ07491.1 TetR family transcriptional regulator [Aeromicrobium sp. PE09-221]
MTGTRVTRAERQAQTRGRLIEVAQEMFLRDGYAATSLDKVALEAGFSKGAVYSNFAGKEELCLAVLDVIHAEKVRGVREAFTREADLEAQLKAFADWAHDGLGEPRWTALEVEFGAVARHNEWVAAELVTRHREIREAIGQLIEYVVEEAGLTSRLPIPTAAAALLSLGVGLGALRSLDAHIDVGVFTDVMRALIPPAGDDAPAD